MSRTQLRFALGACVLSAGLLAGSAGEGIAAADPETAGSTAASQSVDSSSQGVSSTTGQVESTAVAGSSDSLGNSSHEQSAGSQATMTMGATTTNTQEPAAAGTNEAVASVAKSEESGSTTTVTTKVASGPAVVESHSSVVVPPPTTVVTPRSTAAAPKAVDPRVVLQTTAPVLKAVANAASAVAVFPGVIAKLPTSPTPVTDVITAIQDMVTSVGAVGVSLARMPSDLASLLGFPVMGPGAIVGVVNGEIGRSLYGAPRSVAAAPASGGSDVSQLLMNSGIDVSSPSSVLRHTSLSGVRATGLSQDVAVSGVAPIAEDVASGPMKSFLEHTVSAVLVPASLTVLAALALPGLGGLLILCTTGMLVGYRQAKAALALRAVGIARFARSGPLGVVRSGSQIVLHSRAPHSDRRRPSGSARALKPVA